jgi:hypothetical protein
MHGQQNTKKLPLTHASHKSNPRPYLRVTWRSAPYVTWVAVTGVEVKTIRGLLLLDTRYLMGLWYTQAKVEGIVLRLHGTGVVIAVP